MDLRPYICERCNGTIDLKTLKCEYCGTPYEDSTLKRIKIEVVRPGVHTIKSEVVIDFDHMAYDPEGARDYALRELRNQLADGLLGFMKLKTAENFNIRSQIIRGTVRVIDPMFNDR